MINLIATATFGLEATIKREITKLGYKITSVSDGRIDFNGDWEAIVNCNLRLRGTDRILVNVGEFNAYSFDELFEKTKAQPWQDWITKDGKFTVTGKSVKSKLYSVSDCQSIVKKAIVEKLKKYHNVSWFEETGPEYKVQVGLLKDKVTLTIDTTGPSLHKRGYRKKTVEAPIKETLAFAMIELSYWRKDRILFDPFCGSGTIPIEAALIARNISPGLYRSFSCEKWPQIQKDLWVKHRKECYEMIDFSFTPEIYASDIDSEALEVAHYSAEKANVLDCIHFEKRDFSDIALPSEYGVMITNPPYGERLGQIDEVEKLYEKMGKLMSNEPNWSVCVITSYENFEKCFGRLADSRRKLYSGMLKTDYYQYYGKNQNKKPK